jgi:hypothetical protein
VDVKARRLDLAELLEGSAVERAFFWLANFAFMAAILIIGRGAIACVAGDFL